MPIWVLLIFTIIGVSVVMATIAECTIELFERLIWRIQERRYAKKEAETAEWLGEWGA